MPVGLIIVLALGHLVVDLAQGALPILLPFLQESFKLSYTAVGAVVLVATFSSSIVQPVFGVFSDRIPSRWLLPAGCFLACLGLVLASAAPAYWLVLVAVLIGGVGNAGYHPEGARVTYYITRKLRATTMSFFSVGGNIGFGLGPLLASFLIVLWGQAGFTGFIVPGLLMGLVLWLALPAIEREVGPAEKAARKRATTGEQPPIRWGALGILVAVVSLRSFMHAGMNTFIPLYYVNYLGGGVEGAGYLLSVFLLAGALGTLVGGPLADRWGRKTLIQASFAAALVPLLVFPYVGGVWIYVAVFLSGFALISSFAPTAVMAQELAPRAVGLASGLAFGFAIGMGGVGALLLGLAADGWGLPLALTIIGLLPVPAFLLTRILPVPGENRAAHADKTAEN